MKIFLLLAFVLVSFPTFAQQPNIIPAPVSAKPMPGSFTISSNTKLILNDSGEKFTADFLNDYLQRIYGFKLEVVKDAKDNYIRFNTLRFMKAPENEGHYTAKISEQNISIEGDSYAGTFYGMQTLLQLLPVKKDNSLKIACISIDDYPRFTYRGMHLDVGRHFFPVDFIKRYIDYIALHKMNTFHWHLTEDQGWRIEIKKYPKLTTVGAYRNGTIIGRYPGKGNDNIKYGGFYTQEEVKEIVKYAAERYITVIPEIEMPGHSSAALTAYPELGCPGTGPYKVEGTWGVFDDVYCAGNEETFTFLQDVIDEVLPLFPSNYIHIGGDESPKANWQKCPRCQKRIKDNNLKDEHELQSYFIQRMEKYINSKGRKIIGWDEILEGGLAPNATVMSWRGEEGGIEAAKQNHDVVMTPVGYVYLDFSQTKNEDSVTIGGFTPVEKTYGYEPIPKELDSTKAKYILGAQGNLWTEYIKYPSKVEYHIFPRMSALSEVLWSPKAKRNFTQFEPRLLTQMKRYELWGANYSKAYFDIQSSLSRTPRNDGLLWKLETKSTAPIFITFANTNTGMKYTEPIPINGSGELEAAVVENGKTLTTLKQKFSFNKATGKKVGLKIQPSPQYPGNGGDLGLVNGIVSDKGFNSPEWFSFYGHNMDAYIDLEKPQPISSVSVNVLKQEPSAIYLPKAVDVYTSADGEKWSAPTTVTPVNNVWPNQRRITVELKDKPTARYVRVLAHNFGTIPEGKRFAGQSSHLFVDEIEVE